MISIIQPPEAMALLSQIETESLSNSDFGDLFDLYRNCSLAVLNSGAVTDNAKELLDRYEDFNINIIKLNSIFGFVVRRISNADFFNRSFSVF